MTETNRDLQAASDVVRELGERLRAVEQALRVEWGDEQWATLESRDAPTRAQADAVRHIKRELDEMDERLCSMEARYALRHGEARPVDRQRMMDFLFTEDRVRRLGQLIDAALGAGTARLERGGGARLAPIMALNIDLRRGGGLDPSTLIGASKPFAPGVAKGTAAV